MEQSPDKLVSAVDLVEPRPEAPYENDFPNLQDFIEKVDKPGQKLKVCIAAEDIVGPIRNGGIGTTYTHLSRLLAKDGHQVVVAYLRGSYCQNRSIDYWIKWYKDFGVSFVPVDPDRINIDCPAPRWIRPIYALYEYLKANSFDLVHVSEWRGSAFLSLMAKKQGLALANTVFAVKASSPWLWNREHGYQIIDRFDDLAKMFAEKRSIELADMVISGSAYMLRWMLEHGYKIPEGNSYVQPNVMVPIDPDQLSSEPRKLAGRRIEIDEIVFFGRLEYRKGLDIFCEAIDRLAADRVELPKITLMGKYGEKIPTHPELSVQEYIREKSGNWPVKPKVMDNLGNQEALDYLLAGNRLAVMPSRIENSTLAVYETAYYGIPCIATDCGGTPELIAESDREEVLTEAYPVSLANKIRQALDKGGYIPEPSFDNDHNLDIWLKFHRAMGAYLKDLADSGQNNFGHSLTKVSVCLAVGQETDYAREVVKRIQSRLDGQTAEMVLVDTDPGGDKDKSWLEGLGLEKPDSYVFLDCDDLDEQAGLNLAASRATGQVLVFLETGTILKPDFIDMLRKAAFVSQAGVFGCFYDRVRCISDIDNGQARRMAVFCGDYSSTFYRPDYLSPVIGIRREIFENLGGFRQDYKIPGAVKELFAKAQLRNVGVQTMPEALAWFVVEFSGRQRLNDKAEAYRVIRPFLESAPHCYKRILMAARGAAQGGFSSGVSVGDGGGVGAIRDPIKVIEDRARQVAQDAGGSPQLRNMGWSVYYLNIRLFRKALALELKLFRLILRLKAFFRIKAKRG